MKVAGAETGPAHAGGMESKPRTPHPSKAAWARAKAAECRAAASSLPLVAGSDWPAVQRRISAQRHLLAEAARFDAMAAWYAARAA